MAAGEEVAAGQKLFTLEAMKMETTVYAERAGTVAEVLAKAGHAGRGGRSAAALRGLRAIFVAGPPPGPLSWGREAASHALSPRREKPMYRAALLGAAAVAALAFWSWPAPAHVKGRALITHGYTISHLGPGTQRRGRGRTPPSATSTTTSAFSGSTCGPGAAPTASTGTTSTGS